MVKTFSIITVAIIAAAVVAVWVFRGGTGRDTQSTKDILSANIDLLDAIETPKLNTADSVLHFESTVADLGRMKIGEKKDVVFRFKNVSVTPVVITRIVTTCGCTSAEYEKRPLRLGGKSEIRVGFEAEEKGMFFKKLSIHYAGGTLPIEVAIKGEVR